MALQQSSVRAQSKHSEAFRVADRLHESVLELLLRVVFREEKHVEARVRGGQAVAVRPVPRGSKHREKTSISINVSKHHLKHREENIDGPIHTYKHRHGR